jgi:microcin C transport system substrate-binding protein
MLTRRSILKTSLALGALPGFVPGFLPRALQAQEAAKTVHAMAMHGDPKYGPDFTHVDYVNPQAPKGGTLNTATTGTFDSFNPFILRGNAGPGTATETLLTSTLDEPFSEYGLIAESIEYPEDRSWVAFTLQPQARWHDGNAITVEDVIFSFETLKSKGRPFYRAYYANVVKAEQVDERKVRFQFEMAHNRELPLIMGQLDVLPKHYWKDRDFEAPSLDVPLGSGPYKVEKFEAGRSVTLARVPDYWGKDLPINAGQNNWDRIVYQYYSDETVVFEAFKSGHSDIRSEYSALNWATAYDIEPVRDGRIIQAKIPDQSTQGMQAFVFNTRRDMFKDRKVREALGYAFDFEWSNKTLFYGQYQRMTSYFNGSDLASKGLPTGEEKEILEKYRGKIPDEVFTTEYAPPNTDPPNSIRGNLRKAADILKSAGWEVKNRQLINTATAVPLKFEILLVQPTMERVALPFAQNLERLGVTATMRNVDSSQYQNRIDHFDFDMIVGSFAQSESPGNEQRDFWGSKEANSPGSRNIIGVNDPVVDEIIDLIISASSRESLVARTHALDRVLLWGHYVVPHYYIPFYRVAYWNKFGMPEIVPKYSVGTGGWWVDTAKEAALKKQGN